MFLTTGISSLESFLNLLGVIIMFCIILALCYIVTRWIGGSGLLQQRNKNISVVESYKLGPNQFIQIVKIGNKYISIGIAKDNIEYLSEIPEEGLDLEAYIIEKNKNQSPESFKEIFSKVSKKRTK